MPDDTFDPNDFFAALSLYSFTDPDLWMLKTWLNDFSVTEFMNKGQYPITYEEIQIYNHKIKDSPNDVRFVYKKKDRVAICVIGIHKIDWIHRRGDISLIVNPEFTGKGHGTSAISLIVAHGFEKMNLHKLTAGMWSNNMGSIRAFEKNGFVHEGTLRENYFYRGEPVDELRYGLLRKDWLAAKEKNRPLASSVASASGYPGNLAGSRGNGRE